MPLYNLLYVVGIIFFAYFYTAIIFNPDDVAENMRKYGGFIPGIRPGKRTAEYIDTILARITLVGALYLAMVAILPRVPDHPASRSRRSRSSASSWMR
jgi:preprotein translocase subunit SecY